MQLLWIADLGKTVPGAKPLLASKLSTPCFAGFMLSGYFQGKRNAEHAMAEAYPDHGVCLRPGFIHGTRYVSGVGIPLSFIGRL